MKSRESRLMKMVYLSLLTSVSSFGQEGQQINVVDFANRQEIERQEFQSASGQGHFVIRSDRVLSGIAEENRGTQTLLLARKTFTYVSGTDGASFFVDNVGSNRRSYGSTNGTVLYRDFNARREGPGPNGGSTGEPSFNYGPYLSSVRPLQRDGMDYLDLGFVETSDESGANPNHLEIPACGINWNISILRERREQTMQQLRGRARLVSNLRATLPLEHPMPAELEPFVAFRSLPDENYRLSENTLRVYIGSQVETFPLGSRQNEFYEFRKTDTGIWVIRLEQRQAAAASEALNVENTYAVLIGILPPELILDQIKVGKAFTRDPFVTDETVSQARDQGIFVRVTRENKNYYLRKIGNVKSDELVSGMLANWQYTVVAHDSNGGSDSGERPTSLDYLGLVQHQCYLQSKIF